MSVLVEAVVTSPDDAVSAAAAGAGRIEVCAALPTGGVTPSAGLFEAVRARCSLPIAVMVRPREGGFVYTEGEHEAMIRDVAWFAAQRVEGIVVASLTASNELDLARLRELRHAAGPCNLVFHRAFDLIADQASALEQLIGLGFSRVLTTGGAATALEGTASLARLGAFAAGRIGLLAGGGVRPSNVRQIVDESGVNQVHLGPRRPTQLAPGGMYGAHDELDPDALRAVVEAVR